MDDSEARYLIDQFNKYSSWFLKGLEVMYPMIAVALAIVSLNFVLSNAMGLIPFSNLTIFLFVQILLLATVFAVFLASRSITRAHEHNQRKLIALEKYRSQHKSVPDSLTFEMIVKKKPEDLEKFLVENEPRNRKDIPRN